MELHVLYEDDDLLIVDKPAGVTVNSKPDILANGGSLLYRTWRTKRKVRFLNRLDRDTTGCVWLLKVD